MGQKLLATGIEDSGPPVSSSAVLVAATTAAPARDVRQLAVLINGIVSYTTWPQPPHPVRVCVLGREDLVEQLQSSANPSSPRPISAHDVKAGADFRNQCDVVYVTAIPPENAKIMLFKTVAAPIVTIGEGAEFCSDGGMFCINSAVATTANDARLQFSANLDVISRSGLRVNPSVLLLAKAAKAKP